jgi:4-hydroxymandelate oxidase
VTDLLGRLDPRDFETVARLVLDTPTYEWVRAGDVPGPSASDNTDAFGRWRLLPRALVDVASVDLSVDVLGTRISSPVMVAPVALHRALHPGGEIAAARGVAAAGSVLVLATNASVAIDDVAAACPDASLWLQLYNWTDRDALRALIGRAEAAGCRALVPTVNTALAAAHVPRTVGFRPPAGVSFAHFEVSPPLDATLGWSYIEWLASVSSLPVIPKGVLHPDDARRAVDAGAQGMILSNHGGRQLPRSVATVDALPAVAAAVGDRIPVFLDGGVRSGGDVLLALALGARAVFVGRPAMWGLAVGGAEGVERVLGRLRDELALEAALAGVASLRAIPADLYTRAA